MLLRSLVFALALLSACYVRTRSIIPATGFQRHDQRKLIAANVCADQYQQQRQQRRGCGPGRQSHSRVPHGDGGDVVGDRDDPGRWLNCIDRPNGVGGQPRIVLSIRHTSRFLLPVPAMLLRLNYQAASRSAAWCILPSTDHANPVEQSLRRCAEAQRRLECPACHDCVLTHQHLRGYGQAFDIVFKCHACGKKSDLDDGTRPGAERLVGAASPSRRVASMIWN